MSDIPHDRQILDILKNYSIFHGVDARKIQEEFLPAMELAHFRKRSSNGGFVTDDYFYIITRGMVHGFLTNQEGERKVSVFVLKPGDGFDILTLLGERKNKVSYSCLGREVTCLKIPLEVMRDWAMKEPAISKALLLYMARLLVELEELVFDLSICDTGTRLVKLLLRHSNASLQRDHGTPVLHHLTHEELASLIGSVRVVVSRQVQRLKRMSLVEVEKGKIIIKDLKALIKMLEKQEKDK